ncbi:MAG: hypothetical protein A3B86_00445 [Candidatus Yanofskybacteria bacterium RIFCSPHIGHO2_02_FULL_38_22b]|uniref:Uncharacterized protein n=1 Tax=Candidatus Yanofskybacteria bacterium RIFCSPHIGHO2_02_FULL_38_22b TaxID=1802673 RepID=A0A1F8F1T4_9BACT|nr:MAG: hypothetical protein A2816_02920 [Candidatus Yanofskybacteria bacterium RIFCSPHIGHO2_01_FULL_39_44]OGN06648.1 MAG: hypothetical protein A3B86_00445 [Candidatus Yanofskybacteria bacterium RIFCSPHIGHO2_02_FULL_38_22b]OGN20578.1 MAG: hypothetical protein A2910_01830 [Candidatus Yanofskybacteria bacterium RIFCSPLOWO2_01_FULL_39_28]
MKQELKKKLSRFYTKEQIQIRELLNNLGFAASSVDIIVLKDITLENFKNRQFDVEWMPIDGYSLQEEVLAQMEIKNKIPVTPVEFIGALSKMENMDEVSRICLFQLKLAGSTELSWVHLTANGWIQRTICSIFSGDGFGPHCLFAVKPKSV